jgi:hypothetical protein
MPPLHTLPIDDPRTRFQIAARLLAGSLSERIVDPDERAVERAVIEVVADSVPVGEVGGKQPPLAPGVGEIQQGIDHFAEVDDRGGSHASLSLH